MLIPDLIINRSQKYSEVSRLKSVVAGIPRVLATLNDVRSKQSEIWQNKTLSPLGKKDAIREHIRTKTAPELIRANRTIHAWHENLKGWRTRLEKQDKTQPLMPLGGELRSLLRTMKHGERVKLLMDPGCDPEFFAAIVEAPNAASGVDADLRSIVTEKHIENKYPGQLAQIAEAEECLELLVAATKIAHSDIKTAGDFPREDVLTIFVVEATKASVAAIDADIARQMDAA